MSKAPIVVSLDWSQPFEIMCDASSTTAGAVLRKKEIKFLGPFTVRVEHLMKHKRIMPQSKKNY